MDWRDAEPFEGGFVLGCAVAFMPFEAVSGVFACECHHQAVAGDLPLEALAVGEAHSDLAAGGSLNNVIIGKNVAIGAHDQAAAGPEQGLGGIGGGRLERKDYGSKKSPH